VTAKGIAWLRDHGRGERPWLLWLHYFDPHTVYKEHSGFSERFGTGSDSQLYDGEIAFTDHSIGALLTALEELGLEDRTIVLLAADHGEEFREHGGEGHGKHLHRELTHVPLLFRVPGTPARTVKGPVSLVDVVPTLLDLLALAAPPDLEGESLVGLMRGEAYVRPPVLAEVRLHAPWESLETEQWKLIRSPRTAETRLYAVREDPTEQRDVSGEHPEVVQRLEAELDERVRAAQEKGRRYPRSPGPRLDPEERERLRDLGYLAE
jgi:arylsulfatase A-like enzyme